MDLNLTLMEGFLSDESFGKQILFLSSVHFLLCIIFSVDFLLLSLIKHLRVKVEESQEKVSRAPTRVSELRSFLSCTAEPW